MQCSGYAVVVDSLFIVAPIVCGGFGFWSMSCYAVLSVQSSFLNISPRKRGLVTLLYFSSC